MGLSGPAFGRVAGRLHTFLAGKDTERDYLTPCDNRGKATVGGTPIYFVHESRTEGLDVVDDGPRSDGELQVFTAVRVTDGATYTYDGRVWKVSRVEFDRAAGTDWPHHVYLVRHAH